LNINDLNEAIEYGNSFSFIITLATLRAENDVLYKKSS